MFIIKDNCSLHKTTANSLSLSFGFYLGWAMAGLTIQTTYPRTFLRLPNIFKSNVQLTVYFMLSAQISVFEIRIRIRYVVEVLIIELIIDQETPPFTTEYEGQSWSRKVRQKHRGKSNVCLLALVSKCARFLVFISFFFQLLIILVRFLWKKQARKLTIVAKNN